MSPPIPATRYFVFAPVTPGFEAVLADELAGLNIDGKIRARRGGVELHVSQTGLWLLALQSRVAQSLRVRMGRFQATNFPQLESGLSRLPWDAYLRRGAECRVNVTCRKSALYHSDAVKERVLAFLGTRPGSDEQERAGPDVFLRLLKDRVQVSIDATGELLHRRGYRQETGTASIRETLAAACVQAASLSSEQVVWDPFCGVGTFVIEMAMLKGGGPTSTTRRFAFQDWPTHDAEGYAQFQKTLPGWTQCDATFYGSDTDPSSIGSATRNADSAKVTSVCRFMEGDFETVAERIPKGAAVLTNLPYGRRLRGGRELGATFRRWGDFLRRREDLRPVWVVNGSKFFESATRLPWRKVAAFKNGGIQVELLSLEGK